VRSGAEVPYFNARPVSLALFHVKKGIEKAVSWRKTRGRMEIDSKPSESKAEHRLCLKSLLLKVWSVAQTQ
jgi:hypothetical protein